jgi:hypothetical protein
MQEWEYMTFDLAKPQMEIEDLNRLGREGWEARRSHFRLTRPNALMEDLGQRRGGVP